MTLNLAAAAQKLEALAAELPMQHEDLASTPSPTADVAPADAGTPWTKEVLTTLSACLGPWAGMKSSSQSLCLHHAKSPQASGMTCCQVP